ncbi:aquaporin AQPAe.a-like isoform X1 [Oratosquilla oratoria]|uniref:aquaporin AQPAe.a-like isoform X1 n=1 Tax=Oratosquilla oratoria TaxID=337810 RepID=UPI003F757F50
MGKINDVTEFVGVSEVTEKGNGVWKAVFAEFVGTMIVVFVACSCGISGWTEEYRTSVTQSSLAIGYVVGALVFSLGHISGSHINPAVTCGMLVARNISVLKALLYIVSQSIGGITGAAILKAVTPVNATGDLGITKVNENLTSAQGFGVEVVCTFILVMTIFAVVDERRTDVMGQAPIAIGLAVVACHLSAIPMTGCSMNPARSFGPSVMTGLWENHWVYWAGPIIGGMLAGLLYSYVFRAPKPEPTEDSEAYKMRA